MPAPATLGRTFRRRLDVEDLPPIPVQRGPGRAWLLNPRRLEIVVTAAAYPGIHLRAASRLLLASLPTLRFHSAILQEHGFLVCRRRRGSVHLFLPGMFPKRFEPCLVAWENPGDRRVLTVLAPGRDMTIDEIARILSTSRTKVERSLRRLRLSGLLRSSSSKVGRTYRTSALWVRFEDSCHHDTEPRLHAFLRVLEVDGLRPVVEPLDDRRRRIVVDGPRGRIRFAWPVDPLTRETPAASAR